MLKVDGYGGERERERERERETSRYLSNISASSSVSVERVSRIADFSLERS
jgi:hypothetical protein